MRLATALLLIVILAAGTAHAGKNTEGFGLGLMFGEPTGLNAKLWTGSHTAFDLGLAASLNDNSGTVAYLDYLWHVHDMGDRGRSIVPFYYGLGVRYRENDIEEDTWGIRIPLGLDYLFAKSSWDVFFEVVPIVDVAPAQEFDFSAVIGGRRFF